MGPSSGRRGKACLTCGRGRAWTSLGDAGFVPVRKRLLYAAKTGSAMYEGLSLGPALADGRRLLLLVSDGDDEASEMLLSLAVPQD